MVISLLKAGSSMCMGDGNKFGNFCQVSLEKLGPIDCPLQEFNHDARV